MGAQALKNNPIVTFGEKIYQYSVVRTDRSTVGIVIEPDGSIIVKSPRNLENGKIHAAVNKKRKWIAQKIANFEKVKDPIPKFQEPVSGEKIRYKNKLYRLKMHLHDKKRPRLVLVQKTLHVYLNQDLNSDERGVLVKKLLIKWYKEKAQKFLLQRVKRYTKFLKEKPNSVKVRDIKIRWGSCTKSGNLIFNWKIIMAPISAIDYVILHELCHLKEPNHTHKFWSLLESLLPTYERWKEWLHINGRTLDLRW